MLETAAPICGSDGDVVCNISITIPEQRFDPDSEKNLADLIMRCADNVTVEIGGTLAGRSPPEQATPGKNKNKRS